MTTHPNTLHCGVPIKNRLWRLNTEEAHLSADFKRDDLTSIHLLVLRREHCGHQLTSFDAFSRADAVQSNTESLLQLFLRAATHLKKCYKDARHGGKSQAYPFQAYLEVVFESDEFRTERLASAGSDSAVASGVYNVRHDVMKNTLHYPEEELERVTRAQTGVVDHTLTTFMSEIGAGREVREYRLWFMCNDNTVHFNSALTDMLSMAFAMHEKRVTPATIISEDRNLMKQHAALLANGELASNVTKMSAVAGDNERWTLFQNMSGYLNFIADYTGRPEYRSEHTIRAAMSRATDLNNEDNPANPNNVYSPTLYFSRDLRHIYEPQARFANYCQSLPNNEYRWRFPLTSCVLEVPTDELEVAPFCCKLTPDHQARVIQPRLSVVHYPPICRLRGSTLFAKVLASGRSFEALRRGEAAPNVTDEAATAASRARRALDPVAEARATMVSAQEAGVDTDDEADLNAQADADADENADLGAAVLGVVRNQAEIDRLELRRKKMLTEVANKYGAKDPTTLPGWTRGAMPSEYDTEGVVDGEASTSLQPLGASLTSSDGYSRGATERSLTASQQVSAADRTRLATFDHGDARSRKHERTVNEIASGGAGTTALDTLAQHFKHHLPAKRRAITDETEFALRYTTDQDQAFAEYENNCCSSTSTISAIGCTLNRFWETEGKNAKVSVELKMLDKRLSTFGVIVTQMALDYDKACAVYAAHREALLLTFAACDTYRHEYNLHLNVVFYGEAAVSKSFIIELIERLAVEGTVRSVNSKTRAAANISESRDDIMDAYQEMNAAWLVAPTTGGAARPDGAKEHDQFKERVGTCRVTTEYFHLTVDGRRTSLLAHSSQIGNFGGATNLKKSDIAHPMLTRLWAVAMLSMRSPHVDMAEVDAAARAHSEGRLQLTLSNEVKHDYRMFQLWHYHVEKLIYIGGLAEPSLAVFGLYMPIFRKTLQSEFGISVPIRTMFRMEKLLRQLVVREALWRTFVLPGAPYRDKEFRIQQLKHVDPWLRDNQKMVFWLFEFSLDQYVDVYETILKERLRAFLEPMYTDVGLFKRDNFGMGTLDLNDGAERDFNEPEPSRPSVQRGVVDRSRTDGRAAQIAARHGTAQPGAATRQYDRTAAQLQSAAAAEAVSNARFGATDVATATPQVPIETSPLIASYAPSGLPLIRVDRQVEYNFQYVKLATSVFDLSKRLESLMNVAVRPLSAEQMREEFKTLTQLTIKTRRYVQDPLHGTPGHLYPVMPDPNDTKEYKIFAMRIVWEERRIYIATGLLFTPYANPAAAVVERCFDRFAPPGDVYVSGFPYKADTPSLFAVNSMRNVRRDHLVLNPATLDAEAMKWVRGGAHYREVERELKQARQDGRRLPPWVTREAYIVDCAVDQYATRVRLHRVGLPWDNADLVARFDVRAADAAWKLAVADIGGKYPESAYQDLFKTSRGKRARDAIAGQNELPLARNRSIRGERVGDVFADAVGSVFEISQGTAASRATLNLSARLTTSARSTPGVAMMLEEYEQMYHVDKRRRAELRSAAEEYERDEATQHASQQAPVEPPDPTPEDLLI